MIGSEGWYVQLSLYETVGELVILQQEKPVLLLGVHKEPDSPELIANFLAVRADIVPEFLRYGNGKALAAIKNARGHLREKD